MLKKNLELQFLEILQGRDGLNDKEQFSLKLQQRGFLGESELYDLLLKYGQRDWALLHDLWLGVGGTTQIDLMLVTHSGILVLDAKNYEGHYSHINGQAMINGKRVNHDIFTQLNRSIEKVREMCKQLGYNGTVKGRVVFVNPDSQLQVEGEAAELALNRAGLIGLVQQIYESEVISMPANLKTFQMQKLISERYRIKNPYPPKSLSVEQVSQLKSGLCCPECMSFEVELSRYKATCRQCGHVESKERVIVRTICEYGVLTHERVLRATEIRVLLGNQVPFHYVSKILSKNFQQLMTGRYSHYENPATGLKDVTLLKKYNFKK